MTAIHQGLDIQQLSVVLERAINLKSGDWFKAQDPYCKLKCGNREEKSLTIKGGGRNPVWNQTFTFTIRPEDLELRVEIWDRDTWTRDDLVGTATVSLLQVRQQGRAKVHAPVYTAENKPHGTLYLDLQFKTTQLASTSMRPHGTPASSFQSPASGYYNPASSSVAYPPAHPYPPAAPAPAPVPQAPTYAQPQPQWGSFQTQTSTAGHYRAFDADEQLSVEELQAKMARLTVQRDRVNLQLLHNYRILQQYANQHDVEKRRWYYDLQRSYEEGNKELRDLQQDIHAVQTKINQKTTAAPQPSLGPHPLANTPSVTAWDNLPAANPSHNPYHHPPPNTHHQNTQPYRPLHPTPSMQGSQYAPEPILQTHSLNGTADGYTRTSSASSGLYSMLNPYNSQVLPQPLGDEHHGDVYTLHPGASQPLAHHHPPDNHAAAATHATSDAESGGVVGHGRVHDGDSLVSNRLQRAGAGSRPGSVPPELMSAAAESTATVGTAAANGSVAVAATVSEEEAIAARRRAIQRWKRFIAFVRINYLYAKKTKDVVILEDSHEAAPLPPPPPPPKAMPPLPPPRPPGVPGGPAPLPPRAVAAAGAVLNLPFGRMSNAAAARAQQDGEDEQEDDGIFRDRAFVDNIRVVRNPGSLRAKNDSVRGPVGGAFLPPPLDAGMNLTQALKDRGGHHAKVLEDVEKYGDMIRQLVVKVEKAQCTTMTELCILVDSVNSDLDLLVDVPAVLKHFPEWPESRFDTMQEAVDLYRKRLGSKLRAMANWEAPASAMDAIMDSRKLVDDTRHMLDRLMPERHSKEKRFKEHGLPWDRKIWSQVNMAALKLCAQQLRITLDAVKEPSQLTHKQCVDLLQGSLDMQYKVYQMAGGYNREVQQLSHEAFETWKQFTERESE